MLLDARGLENVSFFLLMVLHLFKEVPCLSPFRLPSRNTTGWGGQAYEQQKFTRLGCHCGQVRTLL